MTRKYNKNKTHLGFGPPDPRQEALRQYAQLQITYAPMFDAQRSLSRLIESQTNWSLVDEGMMIGADWRPVHGYRDAVFESPAGIDLALRVFHAPKRVECDTPIPQTVQKLINQWAATTTSQED